MLYVTNADKSNDDYKIKKFNDAKNDLELFKKNFNFGEKDTFYNIFINMSSQSNACYNFNNDYAKYIGKKIRLYFHKTESIDKICDVFVENKDIFNKIFNMILYSEFEYYTKLKNVIDEYIIHNNITNYFIYY